MSSGEEKVCGFAWKNRNSAVVVAIRATTKPVIARGYPPKLLPRAAIASKLGDSAIQRNPSMSDVRSSGYGSDTNSRVSGYEGTNQPCAGISVAVSRQDALRTIASRPIALLFSSLATGEHDAILRRHLVVSSASGPCVNPAASIADDLAGRRSSSKAAALSRGFAALRAHHSEPRAASRFRSTGSPA